tara:strand:- start:518 stop:1378 length:861 start_codon:yes stop_codon:yes gene_type:complete
MKIIRYFFEFIIIKFLFLIFKLIGYKRSSDLGEKIGKIFGPLFRNKKIILENLEFSNIEDNEYSRTKLIREMWGSYGRIFSEYPFIEKFKSGNLQDFIKINGQEILNEILETKKQVIFVSGHFSNFELMAQQIEKKNIKLAAIYRPLNNFFLNKTMEEIRKKFICKNQIKKGLSGTREILKYLKDGCSIALMIDQRVTEGIKVNFFNRKAFTTTIPAQLIKKYKLNVVPVHIERQNKYYFNLSFHKPINFDPTDDVEKITIKLNRCLEDMILKNPSQWIWSHNRWK